MGNKKQKTAPPKAVVEHTEKRRQVRQLGKAGAMVLAAALTVALAAMSLYLTAWKYPEYLEEIAEQTPFYTTPTFFHECMLRAGGLLTWAASALSSCLHWPWLGASILALLLAILPFILRRAFRVPWQGVAVCFIPSALLLVNMMNMGYMLVVLKVHAVGFNAVLGVYAAALIVWAAQALPSIKTRRTRRIAMVAICAIVVLAAYPLFGFYGIAGTVIGVVAMSLRSMGSKQDAIWAWATAAVAIAATLVYPDLLFRYAYTRIWEGEIYTIGLPTYLWEGDEKRLFYPLIATFVVLALMALLRRWFDKAAVQWGATAIAVAAIAFTPGQVFSDPAFYSTLRMMHCAERADWDGVMREANKINYKPSRVQGMMRMLAQIEQGTGPESMFAYEEGDSLYAAPRQEHFAEMMGSRYMFYYLGKVNFCYRWCMEDMVAYGQRPTYFKFMTKCALVNGEPQLAEKYIDALRQTWAFRDFAEKYEAYVKDTSLVAKDSEMKTIREYINGYNDILDSDGGYVEAYLVLAFAQLTGGTYKMGELSMLCNLMRKDIKGFYTRFRALLHTFNGKVPRHYQEAAVMFSKMEKDVDISSVPIDSGVTERFNAMISAARANGNSDEVNKTALKPQFGDTYWYYFFFGNGVD